MRGIVLAAGKGSRLAGITAAYHKPLLVVNGRPLVVSIVESLLSVTDEPPTVVVAPENVRAIHDVLDAHELSDVDLVVQGRPAGPGHALYLGLRAGSRGTSVIAVMGDNDLGRDDMKIVAEKHASFPSDLVVGITRIPASGCRDFTRWRANGETWVEKVPVTVEDEVYANADASAWVGPIAFPVASMMKILAEDFHSAPMDMGIGHYFNRFTRSFLAEVNARDIGTPQEALS